MPAGAEGRAGIDFDDHLSGLRLILMPGGPGEETVSHAQEVEVILPGVLPIFLLPFEEFELADRIRPAYHPEILSDHPQRIAEIFQLI